MLLRSLFLLALRAALLLLTKVERVNLSYFPGFPGAQLSDQATES